MLLFGVPRLHAARSAIIPGEVEFVSGGWRRVNVHDHVVGSSEESTGRWKWDDHECTRAVARSSSSGLSGYGMGVARVVSVFEMDTHGHVPF